MGRVTRKAGFLGLGKPLEEYYCDKCAVYLEERFFDGLKVYCEPCANSVSFLLVHNWDSPTTAKKHYDRNFFKDTSDGMDKYITQCSRCEGLAIYTKTPSEVRQEYYKVGQQEPQSKAFRCVKHDGFDANGNVRSQARCHHAWMAVGTSKTLNAQATKRYQTMMQHRNEMLEQMFGTDEIDIQYHCFGATHYWCWKCGLYRKLNPQREHLLPTDGL